MPLSRTQYEAAQQSAAEPSIALPPHSGERDEDDHDGRPGKRARHDFDIPRHECLICGTNYADRKSLLRHERTPAHRTRAKMPVIEYVCDHCGKIFARQDNLHRHIEEVHRGRRRVMQSNNDDGASHQLGTAMPDNSLRAATASSEDYAGASRGPEHLHASRCKAVLAPEGCETFSRPENKRTTHMFNTTVHEDAVSSTTSGMLNHTRSSSELPKFSCSASPLLSLFLDQAQDSPYQATDGCPEVMSASTLQQPLCPHNQI